MTLRGEMDEGTVREYVVNLIAKYGPPDWEHSAGQQATDKLSSLVRKLGAVQDNHQVVSQHLKAGTCIRCGERIGFDTKRPLCEVCYPKWAKLKNEAYPEKYCHSRGKEVKSSFMRPLCLACYNRETLHSTD